MRAKSHLSIVSYYESCLDRYGDSHKGVDWPDERDAQTRYEVMLGLIPVLDTKVSLLDFGCGASHLYQFILDNRYDHIDYSGLDLSRKFIELSQKKFPSVPYYCLDILEQPQQLPSFDYVVMNGVFTAKFSLTYDEMSSYFKRLLPCVFEKTRVGLAFNVMSPNVGREQKKLFHFPLDEVSNFLVRCVTRNFVVRHEYGLYDYTVYLYQQPQTWQR